MSDPGNTPKPQALLRPITYRDWIFGVMAWDGILPVCVVAAPLFAMRVFQNHPSAIELTAIVLPITALLIRFVVGSSAIRVNHCSVPVRRAHYGALPLAILKLLSVDSVLILAQNMPKGILLAAKEDQIVWGVMAFLYLTCMLIAMHPG